MEIIGKSVVTLLHLEVFTLASYPSSDDPYAAVE